MSNFLAIATVTGTLRRILQAAVDADMPGAAVTTLRPDQVPDATSSPSINVHLYQAAPNPAWRNADVPTRRGDQTALQRPRIALDLSYLLGCYGKDAQLEPQRLLGTVVRTLHARPVLTRKAIRETIANPAFAALQKSDLADDVELVKFTPVSLSLDELSKVWSVFYQTPYALSVAYQATVVTIEAEEAVQPALPVRSHAVLAVPVQRPLIEDIASEGDDGLLVEGATLVLRGKGFRSEGTLVRLGGVEAKPSRVTADEIRVVLTSPPLPPGALRAGAQGVQVVHTARLGSGAPHATAESPVAAFVLRPAVTPGKVERAGEMVRIEVKFKPSLRNGQRAVLLLNPQGAEASDALAFPSAPEPQDADAKVWKVGVEPGTYLLRVQVDGAESALGIEEDQRSPDFGTYASPRVVVP
jgi:hypothetical protein